MTQLTAGELQALYRLLSSIASFDALREKISRMIAEGSATAHRGPKIFELRLPLAIREKNAKGKEFLTHVAPTLNAYGSMKPWQQAKLRRYIDLRIMAELTTWPRARHASAAVSKRFVRVTRFSSVQPDEIGVDVIGGKVPIDRLVKASILRGDTTADIEREAMWHKAAPGDGSLFVEVFELAGLV